MPDDVEYRTKPEIATSQIDRALANGVRVSAWTFDALYSHAGSFLNGLESRRQVFVGEIQSNTEGWVRKPPIRRKSAKKRGQRGRRKKSPRVAWPSSKVCNLLTYSPVFREQTWQPYRIKDTNKGPEVWEVKWAVFYRKDEAGFPTRRHCLIVARNVLTDEVKYFLCNRVPGERNSVTGQCITLRWMLRVAFGRCSIESCFREGKEELGLDHYEVRGWRCVRRHFYVTQLSHLFCARIRQEYDESSSEKVDRITVEQVRSAMNVWLDTADLQQAATRRQRFKEELDKQQYYQRRNKQARKSHTKTRLRRLARLGIDPDQIKSCLTTTDDDQNR